MTPGSRSPATRTGCQRVSRHVAGPGGASLGRQRLQQTDTARTDRQQVLDRVHAAPPPAGCARRARARPAWRASRRPASRRSDAAVRGNSQRPASAAMSTPASASDGAAEGRSSDGDRSRPAAAPRCRSPRRAGADSAATRLRAMQPPLDLQLTHQPAELVEERQQRRGAGTRALSVTACAWMAPEPGLQPIEDHRRPSDASCRLRLGGARRRPASHGAPALPADSCLTVAHARHVLRLPQLSRRQRPRRAMVNGWA